MLNISPALYDYCLYLFSILNSQSLQDMVVPCNKFFPDTRSTGELYIDLEFCYVLCFETCRGDESRFAGAIVGFLSKVLRIDKRLSFALAVARSIINNRKVKDASSSSRRIVVTLKYRYSSTNGVELLYLDVLVVDFNPCKNTPCYCFTRP